MKLRVFNYYGGALLVALGISANALVRIVFDLTPLEGVQPNLVVRFLIFIISTSIIFGLFLSKRIVVRRSTILVVLFLYLYLIRLVVDAGSDYKLIRSPVYEYFYYFIVGIFVPVVSIGISRKIDFDLAGRIVFWILSGCSMYYASQYYSLIGTDFGRINQSFYGINPLEIGYLGAFVVCLSFLKLFSSGEIEGRFDLGLKIAALLAGVVCLAISGSRGPVLTTILVASLFFLIRSEANIIRKVFSASALLVIFSFFFVFISSSGSSALLRLTNTGNRIQAGEEGRFVLYADSYNLILDNIFLGYGVELPGGVYTHNIILDAFLALGILGGGFFLIILFIGIYRSMLLIRRGRYEWLGILYFVVFGWASFSSALYLLTPFWIVLISVLVASEYVLNDRKSRYPSMDSIKLKAHDAGRSPELRSGM